MVVLGARQAQGGEDAEPTEQRSVLRNRFLPMRGRAGGVAARDGHVAAGSYVRTGEEKGSVGISGCPESQTTYSGDSVRGDQARWVFEPA